MKTAIKGIIFDFGGVLSSHLPLAAQERLSRIAGVALEVLKPDYIRLRPEYDRGTVSAAQYWKSVLSSHGVTPDKQMLGRLIEADVRGWTQINDEMISFIRSIRSEISTLGVLSNMNVECLQYVKKNFSWLDLFDIRVFSCNVKLIKPEPQIYEYCLNSMALEPNECLFIDDAEENTAAAAEMGMFSLHFKSVSLFKDVLKKKYRME